MAACKDDETDCTTTIWYEDADKDGLGNSAVSQKSCTQPSGYVSNSSDSDDTDASNGASLHAAFADFNTDHYNIYLDGTEVVLETDGLPNHTSPYWSNRIFPGFKSRWMMPRW